MREVGTQQFLTFTRLNLITVLTYAALAFVIADDLLLLAFPKYVGAETAVRVLCAVAVFRSVGYVMPPLLDGVGHPVLTTLAPGERSLPGGMTVEAPQKPSRSAHPSRPKQKNNGRRRGGRRPARTSGGHSPASFCSGRR